MISIYSNNVLLPEGLKPATILVKNGKIAELKPGKFLFDEVPFINAGEDLVMSGLIDPHVHINEPGRTEWEGFETASKAAAAGGVTTIIDMPLNSSPVTVSAEAFDIKTEAARGKLNVNCGFWGGLVPDSLKHLPGLLKKPISGIKVFLTHSGIDEFPDIGEKDLSEAMPLIRSVGMPVLAHCEISRPHMGQELLAHKPSNYQAYLASRPQSWELEAIELMIKLCRQTGCRTHIVHLSASQALFLIEKAKAEGLPLTVETCAHYLYFSSESIHDGKTVYKCAPPIREEHNRRKLWAAVESGLIDFLGTDHSPAPPEMKEMESGDLAKAWGGIAGLQFFLPAIWTKARERGFSVEQLSKLWSINAARFLALDRKKGKIAVGFDADLVIWQPDEAFIVSEKMILHRHKPTPYLGETLYGKVVKTFVNGNLVYDSGEFVKRGCGELV